jgi:MYXO-CTERM domain-containing protein
VGQFGADMLAFVGLERQGGTLVYNINDPNNPSYVGYISAGENYANGLVGPESMVFISAADSPTGSAMLVTGYEITNGISVYSVPEPSRAMLGLVGVAFVALRRRRVS